MTLFDFLRRESTAPVRRLAILAGLAGLSSAAILAIINAAAEDAAHQERSAREALLFAIVIAIYFISQRHVMLVATSEIEKVLDRIRVRLADKIRRCDLRPLEVIGRASIYSSIQKETTSISQSALVLVLGAQFAILVFFTAFYVAWLSRPAFILTVVGTTVVAMFFLKWGERLRKELHETLERENDIFDSLTHLLDGFKEVRMNTARSDDLFARFQEISSSATSLKVRTQAEVSSQFILSQVAFYLMLAVVVFVVPGLSQTLSAETGTALSDNIVKTATAILFLVGPVSGLVGAIPQLETANAACENILELESLLEKTAREHPEAAVAATSFEEISLSGVVFTYEDPHASRPFTLGPVDLTIPAGEMVFIAGGNGTGKSTLLKLLAALYYPIQGVVRLDGKPVVASNRAAYRGLFSVIFTDYHLFDRLYGLSAVEQERIEGLLDDLELGGKTRIVDGEFETLDLSGGQRKRLALLVSLLEDRPICVYDEVAADQDPEFRRRYYEEILPALKRQGKTIIAVSHDDRYFDVADRLLKMEDGRFVSGDHI